MRHFYRKNFFVAADGLSPRPRQEIRVFKIGKNPPDFQSKTLIPQNKNQNFQKVFNLLSQIELRESRTDIRGLFSFQKCR